MVESHNALQQIEGLAIDWLPVSANTPYANRTIGDAKVRTRTGVSVVAVIRGDQAHPAPGPDFHLEVDDVLVVIGTGAGIGSVRMLLAAG